MVFSVKVWLLSFTINNDFFLVSLKTLKFTGVVLTSYSMDLVQKNYCLKIFVIRQWLIMELLSSMVIFNQ